MDFFKNFINKITGWVDQIFGFFGIYTSKYSELLVYILMAYVLGRAIKGKFNITVNK